ncbi:DUF4872 domain-containing protein [Thermoleophilia bacterium SCSIO 60948]|nr:DUF4872 domain-containing protein [Thermoleophilia bacterium SCSIO 60948]
MNDERPAAPADRRDADPAVASRRFPHRKAGHCGSGALRDLLEFLVGRTADLEIDVASHLGLPLDVRGTGDDRRAWAWVKEQVDAGTPPMVWADIGRLEDLRVRMHNRRHDVVVVDYDEREGVALVADNDREELQRCSLDSLAAARNSDGFPGPNRNRMFPYSFAGPLRPPREALQDAIARAVGNMRGDGGEALAGLAGQTGLAGADAFAAGYERWPATFGEDLPAAMRGLRVFIVKAGTGGAMFRSLHATFLHDAAGLLDDAELARIGAVYDELAETYGELARISESDDAALAHVAGVPAVAQIARLEADGVDRMERWTETAA